MDIFLIDAIGPFFRAYKKRRINWSKIPFNSLSLEGEERRKLFDQIGDDMHTFCHRVRDIGYNSVTLDDVAHLAPHPWYEEDINRKIDIYREEYRRLFSIIGEYGLDIYLTMDLLSFTPALKERIGTSQAKALEFLEWQIKMILADFPEVAGIIVRIGECDGKDVVGDFKSELILKTPKHLNRMLHRLLPVFEQHDRTLILRNWTVGAYRIGDFIWHRQTTARVLRGVDSPNFILSMKYGESDFFRYLPLNKHFFRFKNIRKLIELQAKREYEGCGEYPSFIGWDYGEYRDQLKTADNMAGVSVWCQTGGWIPFRRLTFLEDRGIWNELNSYVSVKLFVENCSVEEAIQGFCGERNIVNSTWFTELLVLNDEVIKELLYIKELAGRKLFFRRVRIPPLLTVFWNNIFINHSVRKVLLSQIENPQSCVSAGEKALQKIERMMELADQLNLPKEDIEYMYDTFTILQLARHYYFEPYSPEIRKRIKKAKRQYKKKYPKNVRPRYRIKTNYTPFPISRRHISLLMRVSLRSKRGYRLVDYLFTLHLLGVIYRGLVKLRPSTVPEFARKHAMGIDTIFR